MAALSLGLAVSLSGQNPAVTVAIDASKGRHPISPLLYGVAYAPDAATLADLNAPANRLGGNPTSRYNWQSNVDNRCADYYFESIPYPSATAGEVEGLYGIGVNAEFMYYFAPSTPKCFRNNSSESRAPSSVSHTDLAC